MAQYRVKRRLSLRWSTQTTTQCQLLGQRRVLTQQYYLHERMLICSRRLRELCLINFQRRFFCHQLGCCNVQSKFGILLWNSLLGKKINESFADRKQKLFKAVQYNLTIPPCFSQSAAPLWFYIINATI